MDELLGMLLSFVLPLIISVVVIYLIIWFLYNNIIRPDIKKHMAEQELRHEENKDFQRAMFEELREIKELLKENSAKQ